MPSFPPVDAGPSRRGRHRAPRSGRQGRVVALAAGVPLLPAGLLGALAAPAAHADTDWDALARCESGGDWNINTGNGYSGGLQFSPSTWRSFGGSGSAHNASREQQIAVAERVKAGQGMNAWPTCSRKTGQTSNAPNSGTRSVSSGSSSSGSGSSSGSSSSAGSGSYTVRSGDTLSSIAASNGSSWRDLQTRNADVITDPNLILPGQTINL